MVAFNCAAAHRLDAAVCDPVRALEWAPEAAVEFPAAQQQPSAKPQPEQQAGAAKAGILDKRRRHVGPNLALFFEEDPLHIVRGQGCELFDAEVRHRGRPGAGSCRA